MNRRANRAVLDRLEALEKAARQIEKKPANSIGMLDHLRDLRNRFGIVLPHNGREP